MGEEGRRIRCYASPQLTKHLHCYIEGPATVSDEEEPQTLAGAVAVERARRYSTYTPPPYTAPDDSDLTLAKRQRKTRSAVADAQENVARRNLQIERAQAQALRAQLALERKSEDAKLAAAGYKRSFWTGRIVPVARSRRAVAHVRRI
jgi:hypothetical protein